LRRYTSAAPSPRIPPMDSDPASTSRWGCHQSDKISHINMGDYRIDTVISHIISPYPISHIDIHIDISLMSDLPILSPISISHIDLPIICCHSGCQRTRDDAATASASASESASASASASASTCLPTCPLVIRGLPGRTRTPGASVYTRRRPSLSLPCVMYADLTTRDTLLMWHTRGKTSLRVGMCD
jgi:hypothetical protein